MQVQIVAIQSYAESIINAFTLNQLADVGSLYHQWLTANVVQSDAVSQLLALFFVIIRFVVPIAFVTLLLKRITTNVYVHVAAIGLTAFAYTYLYFDPLKEYAKLSYNIAGFFGFLAASPSLTTKPLVFTFLDNMAAVVAVKLAVAFLGTIVFFAVILGLGTVVVWLLTAGKSIWAYTERNFKATVIQLAIIFFVLYGALGAFKGLISTFVIFLGGLSVRDGIMRIRGFEKQCYVKDDRLICKWVR